MIIITYKIIPLSVTPNFTESGHGDSFCADLYVRNKSLFLVFGHAVRYCRSVGTVDAEIKIPLGGSTGLSKVSSFIQGYLLCVSFLFCVSVRECFPPYIPLVLYIIYFVFFVFLFFVCCCCCCFCNLLSHVEFCTHVKDHVVHVRVRWIMETRKEPSIHCIT